MNWKRILCFFFGHDWIDDETNKCTVGLGIIYHSRVCLFCKKYDDIVEKKLIIQKQEIKEIEEDNRIQKYREKERNEILKKIGRKN